MRFRVRWNKEKRNMESTPTILELLDRLVDMLVKQFPRGIAVSVFCAYFRDIQGVPRNSPNFELEYLFNESSDFQNENSFGLP